MLEIKNLFTSFGKVKMLRNLSLSVAPGEIVCLLGSNGSGKSTTIRTIIGLIKPDSGTIEYQKERIERLKTFQIIRKGISIVPEGRKLFPKMTVQENLATALINFPSINPEEAETRVFTLFPVLKERRSQLAGTLSGGEQAMLAISRAMVQKPKLLILDEPSFGLAPILVEEFYETIKSIRTTGTTIFLSEQNAGKALEISDRGYVLQKGEIIIQGTTAQLLESDEVQKAYLGQ